MMSLLSGFTAALMAFSMLGMVLAVPLLDKLAILSPGARDVLKRASPAAPRFVVYQDAWTYPLPAASQLQGYSVYALSFWLTSGAADMALGWQELTASQRASYLREYNAAGISLIVSAFGSTDAPTSSGVNPVTIANDLASWVLQYGVQGVDIDYEDFNAFDGSTGAAESWLISLTRQLRARLPQGQYILSHAPVAPWFSPNVWSGGGYLGVHKSVGSLIDWYNVQFYNQGATEYTTCSGLLKASSSIWPETALFQIAANGVSLNKLVIGKPGTAGDASNGYMSTSTLASCVAQARSNGWNAGVMVWEYPHVGSSWINAVRGHTWPLAGSIDPVTPPSTPNATASATPVALPPTTSTTTSPTSSPTSTAPSGSGNCDGVSAWVNNVVYVSGNKVTYDGDLWTANQWKQDEVPGGLSGGWTNDAKCT